jgi:hypothetical protein
MRKLVLKVPAPKEQSLLRGLPANDYFEWCGEYFVRVESESLQTAEYLQNTISNETCGLKIGI